MKKALLSGCLASLGLVVFYFIFMGLLSGSLTATLSQFRELWFWIILLSIGLGVQVGLYVRITEILRAAASVKRTMLASGSVSSVSMVACCAHHLTEVLPFLGLSAVSPFLVSYQVPLLRASLFVNLLGIIVMVKNLRQIKSHV